MHIKPILPLPMSSPEVTEHINFRVFLAEGMNIAANVCSTVGHKMVASWLNLSGPVLIGPEIGEKIQKKYHLLCEALKVSYAEAALYLMQGVEAFGSVVGNLSQVSSAITQIASVTNIMALTFIFSCFMPRFLLATCSIGMAASLILLYREHSLISEFKKKKGAEALRFIEANPILQRFYKIENLDALAIQLKLRELGFEGLGQCHTSAELIAKTLEIYESLNVGDCSNELLIGEILAKKAALESNVEKLLKMAEADFQKEIFCHILSLLALALVISAFSCQIHNPKNSLAPSMLSSAASVIALGVLLYDGFLSYKSQKKFTELLEEIERGQGQRQG